MAWLPGWDSIADSGWWSSFWFWFGILCLFALGASEVVSHVYGLRKDALVAIEQGAVDGRHAAELGGLKDQLAESGKKVADLETQQVARHLRPDQKAALIAALSPFRGQKILVWCLVSSWDCNTYAEELQSVFRDAAWIIERTTFGTADYDVVGIEPVVNERMVAASLDEPPIPAATALATALFQLQLTKSKAVNWHASVPVGAILIRIGRIQA